MLIALNGVKMGDRGRVYKFGRGHRKVNYMEALVGGEICFVEAKEKWSTCRVWLGGAIGSMEKGST